MGLQKYRADEAGPAEDNGAIPWYCKWMGGPTLAKIAACPTPWGPRMVYITGEADTWFSVPAACKVAGSTVRGYVTTDKAEGGYHFRPLTAERERIGMLLASKAAH